MRGRRAGLVLAGVLVLPIAAGAGTAAAAVVPGQFIAKLHTEGLGRAPSPGEWARGVRFFERRGCRLASLRRAARAVYAGREFGRLPYDVLDRVAALHRGVLNRDPVRRVVRGARWPAALRAVLRGGELKRLSRRICDRDGGAYGFDDRLGLWSPRVRGRGFRGGEEGLRAALARAARRGGGTVWLAQRAVIRIGRGTGREALRIPAGVTLATVGLPSNRAYLRMARLVRVGDTCIGGASCAQPVIALEGGRSPGAPGAVLRSVWVDGRGGDRRLHGSAVQMESGANSRVVRARLTGSATSGGNVLGIHGSANFLRLVCSGARVTDSLVTGYTTSHRTGRWADGITVGCEDAHVARNAVVDASDVGIVLFGNAGQVQRSQVRDNLVLSAGNSAFAGIAADPHGVCAGTCEDERPRDFRGALIAGNVLVTGPRTAFGLGVVLGMRALFDAPPDGFGAAAAANGTGAASARTTIGVAVSGMHQARVSGNTGRWVIAPVNTCPPATVAASVAAGLASFDGPAPPFADVRIARCWQEPR